MLAAFGYLVLAALAASMVLCYQRPAFAFALVLILYPLKQLQMTYLPIFAQHSSWFNMIIFAGVCIAVLSSVTRGRGVFIGYWNRYAVLLLFMYMFGLFAILYSPSQDTAIARAIDGAPYWVMQILLLPLVFSDVRDVQRFFMPFLIAGCVVIGLFLTNPQAKFYAGRLTLEIGYFQGVADYRGSPLATAQMGGQLAIVAALMLPSRATRLVNLARLGGVFLGLGIAVAAGSRGQLILALLVMALFWPLARPVRNVKQFFVSLIGLGAVGGVALIALRFFIAQNVEQSRRWDLQAQFDTLADRAFEAWILIDALLQQPAKWLFGLGTNAYSYVSGHPHSYAHNLFIEMLGEYGLLGITVTIVLLVWMYKAGREFWTSHREDPSERSAAAVMLALGAYLVLLSLKQGTFVGAPDTWYTMAIVCRLVYRERVFAAWNAQFASPEDEIPLVSYEDPGEPASAEARA
ncbi:MAG: O-antigen ligase family protein [Planctomycetota bacterium]|nr:O-antigen ligase family protein [Planctomycetota bacterium]